MKEFLSAKKIIREFRFNVMLDAREFSKEKIFENEHVLVQGVTDCIYENAAGELIEKVTKDTRRKKEINEAYMENLFAEVSALYKLDQIEKTESRALGEMPKESILLLASIATVWLFIGAFAAVSLVRSRKKKTHKVTDVVS